MLRTSGGTPRMYELPHPGQSMLPSYFGYAAGIIQLFAERARQRRALANLDEHLLRDIGLNRAEVAGEVRKHFWQN